MSIRRHAARTATRVTAYRLARRSGWAALGIFLAGLWASTTRRPAPRERIGRRQEYMTGHTIHGPHTVKELAEHVYNHPDDYLATVDLAQAVREFIAREEAQDG